MKKYKIISLIFVCAFLVLTFCCSFAGKMVDVEVKPPLGAVGPFTSSYAIFKIDLDSVNTSNYWDSTSYAVGYFSFVPRPGSADVNVEIYDSSGTLLRSGPLSYLNAGLSAVTTGSITLSGQVYNNIYGTFSYSTGVYYVKVISLASGSDVSFTYGSTSGADSYSLLTRSAPVNSSFCSVVSSLPGETPEPEPEPEPEPDLPPPYDATFVDSFFTILIDSILDTTADIGTIFSNLGTSLFITVVDGVNQLSIFGIVLSIMLGVSVALGLCNIVLDYIITLGRKKR